VIVKLHTFNLAVLVLILKSTPNIDSIREFIRTSLKLRAFVRVLRLALMHVMLVKALSTIFASHLISKKIINK